MASPGDGLMVPTPGGPGQYPFIIRQLRPDDSPQQLSNLRLGQRDQITSVSFLFDLRLLLDNGVVVASLRIAASIAKASIESVT